MIVCCRAVIEIIKYCSKHLPRYSLGFLWKILMDKNTISSCLIIISSPIRRFRSNQNGGDIESKNEDATGENSK